MRTLKLLPILGLALAALALADCGGSEERDSGGGAVPASGAPIPGGGLSIEEAIASDLDGPLMVTGALFAVEGEPVRLCSAIAESFPPQCAGESLVVEGLDLASVPGLQVAGEVSWAEGASLLGTVEDGVLSVSQTSI